MSKATRMLAMAGMALVAGATFSAAPAAASTSTAQGATSATHSVQQQATADRDWVVGYYRTRGECERVGYIGERFNRWDDHDCERVRRGFRILWRLEVSRDWNDGHGWPGHGGPGHGGPGNGWPGHGGPGQGGPGGPGHGGPGGPGQGGPGGPGHNWPGHGGPRR